MVVHGPRSSSGGEPPHEPACGRGSAGGSTSRGSDTNPRSWIRSAPSIPLRRPARHRERIASNSDCGKMSRLEDRGVIAPASGPGGANDRGVHARDAQREAERRGDARRRDRPGGSRRPAFGFAPSRARHRRFRASRRVARPRWPSAAWRSRPSGAGGPSARSVRWPPGRRCSPRSGACRTRRTRSRTAPHGRRRCSRCSGVYPFSRARKHRVDDVPLAELVLGTTVELDQVNAIGLEPAGGCARCSGAATRASSRPRPASRDARTW